MAKKASEGAPNGEAKTNKSVSLTFSTESELSTYELLAKAAKEDDRSINSFIVRILTGKEKFGLQSEA